MRGAIAMGIVVVSLGGVFAVALNACQVDTHTIVCERTGLRCSDSLVCSGDHSVCIEPERKCGDGTHDPDEMCDDGNVTGGDGCSADCQSDERCGNGVLDTVAGEECDFARPEDRDHCSSSCKLERCGNGTVDREEECDSSGMDSMMCTFDCKISRCGDGHLNRAADELCDSGGQDVPDCNGRLCTLPTCGDFYTNRAAHEQCDSGAADMPGCNGNTAPEPVRCQFPRCGDGYVNPTFTPPKASTPEECDDGPNNDDQRSNACRTNCHAPHCGDDTVDDGEECDDGTRNSDTAPNACRASSCLRAFCGDGVVDSGNPLREECDNGADNSDSLPDACRKSCHRASCGDGVLDTGEDCEPGVVACPSASQTCRASGANRCHCTL